VAGVSKASQYSSSYTCYSKLPVSHKVNLLWALEPCHLNPRVLNDCNVLELDCMLYVAVGVLPMSRLDSLDIVTNTAVVQQEYERRGRPLSGRTAREVCDAVRDQHPQAWQMLVAAAMAAQQMMQALPGNGVPFAGNVGTGGVAGGWAAPQLGMPGVPDASPLNPMGSVPWQFPPTPGAPAPGVPAGTLGAPAGALLNGPETPVMTAALKNTAAPTTPCGSQASTTPGKASTATPASTKGVSEPGVSDIELLESRKGRPYLHDRETGQVRQLRRRSSGGTDDWVLTRARDGNVYLADLAGDLPRLRAVDVLAGATMPWEAGPGVPRGEAGPSSQEPAVEPEPINVHVPPAPDTPDGLRDFPPSPVRSHASSD
jgi:hypothetical protein